MTPNQIGALTTLIFIAVFYIGTPLWAERRGRNWKLWLVLAFLFPVISLIALFLLPNKRIKGTSFDVTKQEEGKPVELETAKSYAIPEQKVQTQPILDTTKRIDEVISSEPSDDAMDDVLADFEDMLMSKSVLHGLSIKGLVGVRLQAEKYDDGGIESFKCWIIVESTTLKKLSDDLNEQVSDTVQDFVRENDFDSAMRDAGFDPDLFNWWPVRVENVGVVTAAKNPPDASKGKGTVAAASSSKKSYTEEFKKEVVHTALTAGTSLSEIARMYEINLTLVRNWKAKYEAEILEVINGNEGSDTALEDDIPTPSAIWHIDRAKFVFSDPTEYKQWKKEKKVFFEFSPSGSDDGGEAVFADAEGTEEDFEVTEDRGLVKITLQKDGPLISAWVGVLAETVDDLDQETLTDWANDQGGWACSTIHLGEFDASIVEDDGGDWRLVVQDVKVNAIEDDDELSQDPDKSSGKGKSNGAQGTVTSDENTTSSERGASALELEIDGSSHNFHCFIAADEDFVSSIVLYSIFSMPDGDVWFGAYYGAVGGGENDGGYFRIDVENGSSEHLDYEEVDALSEDDPAQAAIFQAVMQSLWTLVDDDDGNLTLSEEGRNHYLPDNDGIWIDDNFDGDSLDEVSQQWKIRLKFQS